MTPIERIESLAKSAKHEPDPRAAVAELAQAVLELEKGRKAPAPAPAAKRK